MNYKFYSGTVRHFRNFFSG